MEWSRDYFQQIILCWFLWVELGHVGFYYNIGPMELTPPWGVKHRRRSPRPGAGGLRTARREFLLLPPEGGGRPSARREAQGPEASSRGMPSSIPLGTFTAYYF